MLTATPPEVQEDEIQVDEAEKDSLLLRMSPTRVKENRKAQDCKGFNYIQLIVGMIIFVALSRIVGPPAFRMVTTARSTALEANIQTAAETVRNVLALTPTALDRTSMQSDGKPRATFLAALTTDAPFNWEDDWELGADDDSDTIHIQLLDKATAAIPTTGPLPPKVPWLLGQWDAVRIQARNQDGAWACALIVLKPDAALLDTHGTTPDELIPTNGTADSGTTTGYIAVSLADAHLRGMWFDSGPDVPADNGLHHCSPVTTTSNTDRAHLPTTASTWDIPAGNAGTNPVLPAAVQLTRKM